MKNTLAIWALSIITFLIVYVILLSLFGKENIILGIIGVLLFANIHKDIEKDINKYDDN